jgi:hypothetical protein
MTQSYRIGAPAFIPERRIHFARLARESLGVVIGDIVAALDQAADERSPEAFLATEQAIVQGLMTAASHVAAGLLGYLHRDRGWVQERVAEARGRRPHATRPRGWRRTPVLFLGGARLFLETPYCVRDLRARPGRKRGTGRRGASGSGFHPALEALGISHRATPALRCEVARQTVRGSSFEEAREALAERGIALDKKSVRAIARELGARALQQREARLDAAREGHVFSDELAGKRIVVSVDGGRVRLREGGRRGRRGKRKHRRYRTPWREPKLFAIYVIDNKGKKVSDVPMVYDGTLGDADATFEILCAELQLRGAAQAAEIILVGDGAPWIWNRANDLARALGLEVRKIVQVADFYHAVEHLSAIAELCKGWSEARRKKWVRRMRRLLKAGRVAEVIEIATALCRGRNAAKIRTQVKYFVERKDRMRYKAFRRRGIPLGSGAVESAIRRVINLRLKGPSIFWRGPNAERMLHLRAYFKAGRWDEVMLRVMHASPCGTCTPALITEAA